MPAVDELLDLCLLDVLDIGPPCIQHVHFGGIGVESGHLVPCFRKTQRQRQAYISTSDDGDLKLGALEELRFPINWHESGCTPKLLGIHQSAKPYAKSRINIAGFSPTAKRLCEVRPHVSAVAIGWPNGAR